MNQIYYVYDLETFPNCFLFCGKFTHSPEIQLFEISDRRNEREALVTWLSYLRNVQCEMVGFNNLGFDYPIIHELIINPYQFTYEKASQMANNIIAAQSGFNNFKGIGIQNRVIPQIDLMKVCHFDNANKRTSLKQLQFAMRSESLEDLPFDIRDLTDQEIDVLREYNVHDVTETEKFFKRHEHVINMRREYIQDGVLSGDVLNFSDVKIGTEYLIGKIGKYNCYAGGKPRQTLRYQIFFNRIILPKIYFRTEPFQNVLAWFRKQVIDVTSKEEKPSLEAKLGGLDFHFGVGGVHASAENKIFYTDDEYQIIDIDVTGMYVSVAIANSFAPEHLGENYSRSYRQLKEDRARYPKGSSMNAALKLAGNGAYGNSNNAYSPFYDPQYTFSVTVNGQLQILQLVELIDLLPDCEIIQANTDGITVRLKKSNEPFFKLWCDEWEKMTGLALEYVYYNRMWIKDVNSYISEKMDGELKRKGAYWYPLTEKDYEGWYNKDFSNHASKIAAEKAMTNSWPLEIAVRLITDSFDFMMRYKATGASKLYIGDVKQLKTVRYYVSKSGAPMKKISPPTGEIGQYKRKNKLKDAFFNSIMKEIGPNVWDARIHTGNKTKYEMTTTSVQSGWLVKECNIAKKFDWNDVNWEYYVEEAKKIIIGAK